MSKANSYQTDIKAAIHQTANDLYEVGLMDQQTMRRFDASCRTPIHGFTITRKIALCGNARKSAKPSLPSI